ncbi:MAG TPA: hypothetical protein VNL18_15465 [Gemmatimonadales bacterium]|nr:hypothetical protein [Gemmatimonadales bacterium]
MALPATMVIEDVHGVGRVLSGPAFWETMERLIPRALTPVAAAARAAAPQGRTGRLRRRPFEVRTKRGFALGTVITAEIGTRLPYGHLPERGHRIIPRGPQRKGVPLSRARRKELRSGLKARRAQGAIGFVPGQFFTRRAWEQHEEQTRRLLEALLGMELRGR